VRSGTFVILPPPSSSSGGGGRPAGDEPLLLVHTPHVDGQLGPVRVYAAKALLGGQPAACQPCRCRLSLCAEDDALFFRIESVERLPPSPSDAAAVQEAEAAARSALQHGTVLHSGEARPWDDHKRVSSVLEELQQRCIDGRAAFAEASVTLPEAAEAQMDALQCELRFWWLAIKATSEQRGWTSHAARKPLHSATGSFGHTEWSEELKRRCRRLAATSDELLRIKLGTMGGLPSVAQVVSSWGSISEVAAVGPSQRASAPTPAGSPDEELRGAEGLEALRAALVPQVLRQLHTSLLETGRLSGDSAWMHESFGLADLLADERYQLYGCFDRRGLSEMLRRLRKSAIEMLRHAAAA
jgi:hypothetical protein